MTQNYACDNSHIRSGPDSPKMVLTCVKMFFSCFFKKKIIKIGPNPTEIVIFMANSRWVLTCAKGQKNQNWRYFSLFFEKIDSCWETYKRFTYNLKKK